MDCQTKLTLLGAAFSGLFSGAAIYVNVVEHPARLSCGADIAHAQWAPSYRKAAKWQASLALLGGLVGVINYAKNKNKLALKASVLLLSVIPFTFIAIMPTNKILLENRISSKMKKYNYLLNGVNCMQLEQWPVQFLLEYFYMLQPKSSISIVCLLKVIKACFDLKKVLKFF